MKEFNVVCVKSASWTNKGHLIMEHEKVVKGELYSVVSVSDFGQTGVYYKLGEMPEDCVYASHLFRPTDDTFGEVVSEVINEQIEYEEATKPILV